MPQTRRRWTQKQIDDWLQQGPKPGLATTTTEAVDVPGGKEGEATEGLQITFHRNDGSTITILDTGETTGQTYPGPDPGMPGATAPNYHDEVTYPVVGGPGKKPTEEPRDTRTPEAREADQREKAERDRNLQDPSYGRWRTDAERRADQKADEDRARQQQLDRERNEQQAAANQISQGQLEIAQRGANRADTAEARQAEQAERSAGISEAQLAIAQAREQREAEKYEYERNKPSILSTPSDTQENIAVFDPTTNEIKGVANPIYDRVKVEAARKREELNLQIQLGKLQADQAAAEYNRWFKENVEVPFMQAAEARAQAAEKRAAMQAEEQRRQFAATEARQRRAMGLQAGQEAVRAELQTLPYRVGPAFGEQFGAAVTSLGRGGSMANNASAGINFTKEAFEFDRPDFKAIANSALKDALKGLTNYSPAEGEFPSASYGNINFPGLNFGGQAAPPPAPAMDFQSIMNSIPYQPNQGG